MQVLIRLTSLLGWILSKLPDRVLEGIAWVLGRCIYWGFASRRRLVLQSLAHAFPNYTEGRRRALAKDSCKRTVEMALLGLLLPFWSKEELAKRFDFAAALDFLRPMLEAKQALLVLTPHFSLMEALTLAPLFYKGPLPPMGVVYRPLKQPALEAYIRHTRERGGMRLLSRNAGLLEAIKILQNHGLVAVLFDQNAGVNGLETVFLDRPVYATELPQLLLAKTQARPVFMYMQRSAFARGRLEAGFLEEVPSEGTSLSPAQLCIVQANAHLEKLLKSDDKLCADWLWLHKRWDMKRKWNERLSSAVKKTILPQTLKVRGLGKVPQRRKVFIRLPNWLGDVVMLVPVLKALRKALPDAAVHLLGKPHFEALFQHIAALHGPLHEHFIALPPNKCGCGYWTYFWHLRKARPELHILFTHSFRGDLEAFLIGATERFGIQKPKKYRPLLTHVWPQPEGLDEASIHQTHLWQQFLEYFGLKEPLDIQPFTVQQGLESPQPIQSSANKTPSPPEIPKTIACICGTENSPEKRWPLKHWEGLIARIQEQYPQWNILLLGTAQDTAITRHLAQNAKPGLEDLAGKTDLRQLIAVLQRCDLVVGNDTGGLHLANMLGVPVIGLYGPTNPIRTGPIYRAPYMPIQAKGLPLQAKGLPMEAIRVEAVWDKIAQYWKL